MIPTVNALTIDVEDYFHVSAFAREIDVSEWDQFECRVERNTHALLDIMSAADTRATFFVLGWVAERYPNLVRELHDRGHEVACHGYSHQLIYNQSPEVFHAETDKAKKLLEDVTGEPVLGYRAASYSVTRSSLWALDTIAELGFQYDSSIFPIRHDRYGLIGGPVAPHVLDLPSGRDLVEFPISTARFGNTTLPLTGGGYFRLYPYALSKWLIKRNVRANEPVVFYLHPWEVDPQQPRIDSSLLSRFRHYNNLSRTADRLRRLVTDFPFTTMCEALDNLTPGGSEDLTRFSYSPA